MKKIFVLPGTKVCCITTITDFGCLQVHHLSDEQKDYFTKLLTTSDLDCINDGSKTEI